MTTAFRASSRRMRRRETVDETILANDALLAVQRRQFGKHALFERLTGPEQLWWRSCGSAARSSGGWPSGRQAEQLLALIRGEDLAHSDGAAAAAAAAVLSLSQALTIPDEGDARDLVNAAADDWRSACPAVVMPRTQPPLAVDRALARVVPSLRSRAAALLAGLDSAGQDPGQAMSAISILLMAGAEPQGRTVRSSVALTGTRSDDVIGVGGRLEVRTVPGGPAGLYPDPSMLLTLPASDRDLAPALDLAWQFAAGTGAEGRCVLWRLLLAPQLRTWTVDGTTLGAAFAVAVHQVLRQGPASVPRVLTRLAGFFSRLRPSCAVTGALMREPAGADIVEAGSPSRSLRLAAVDGLVAKSRVARANSWRLVAPLANRELDQARVPEALRMSWVATARDADRRARQVRLGRGALVVVVVLALVGLAYQRIPGVAPAPAAVYTQRPQQPQVTLPPSPPPTAGLLTGPQLQSLLVPAAQFPANYEIENEQASNSGPTLEYGPYLLGCQDFSELPEIGTYDLGSAAEASASIDNDKQTNQFNQGIFEFWNQSGAATFFATARSLYNSCFTDVEDVKYVLRPVDIDGLQAFAETETNDLGADTTIFAVKGVDVYFGGVYSFNSHVLPAVPSLSSLIKNLVANVDAHEK
jgi:hypothetical protein